jgi:5-(carboxyamino)imidazole ribonucleotide synthase
VPWRNLSKPSSQLHVGVLGAGQLAQMLIQEEKLAGLQISPWCLNSNEPASLQAISYFLASDFSDEELKKFFAELDFVIFENEFIDVALLSSQPRSEIKFFPSLPCVSLLRDKLEQKKILNKLAIPTANFVELLDKSGPTSHPKQWQDLSTKLGPRPILKWSLFGYDGKGTFFCEDSTESNSLADDFVQSAYQKGARIFAEKRIPFSQEVSLVSVADSNHQCIHYPLVLSLQKNGICHEIQGPATSFGMSPHLQSDAEAAAKKIALETKLVGCFAIEFFLLQNKPEEPSLLVNEIAPRVHNSGHFSQDAADRSQFLNHLLAVQGKNLTTPLTPSYFGMLNLLGPTNLNFSRSSALLPGELETSLWSLHPKARTHLKLHWYQKREVKTGRKLGHLNYWANTLSEFQQIKEIAEKFQQQIYLFLQNESKGSSI